MEQTIHLPKLVALILGCEAAGAISGIATREGIETWYRTIKKPSFTPPDAVFGPVWTLLYGLMGTALYFVVQTSPAGRGVARLAKVLFVLQLGLNMLWSFIFFGRRSPLGALIEIVLLWIAIVATVLAFWKVSRLASLLLLPYLLWVSFAAALNLQIWRLNR